MTLTIRAGVSFGENYPPNDMNVFPQSLEEALDIFVSYHEEIDLEKMSYYDEDSEELIYRSDGFTMMEGSNLGAIAAVPDGYIPYIITYGYLKKYPVWRKAPLGSLLTKIRDTQTKDNMYYALMAVCDDEYDKKSFSDVFRPKWTETIYKKWRNLFLKSQLSIPELIYIYDLIDERSKK